MQVRVTGGAGEGVFRARLWGPISVPATNSIHRQLEVRGLWDGGAGKSQGLFLV